MFALPYDDAVLRKDKIAARNIRRAYLSFTSQTIGWYERAAIGLLDRRPAFIFLLHATRLNADSLGKLAALLRHDKLHAVTLDQAMADPAYAMIDRYAGRDGNNWIDRLGRPDAQEFALE